MLSVTFDPGFGLVTTSVSCYTYIVTQVQVRLLGLLVIYVAGHVHVPKIKTLARRPLQLASTWMPSPPRRPAVTLTFDLQNLIRSRQLQMNRVNSGSDLSR